MKKKYMKVLKSNFSVKIEKKKKKKETSKVSKIKWKNRERCIDRFSENLIL